MDAVQSNCFKENLKMDADQSICLKDDLKRMLFILTVQASKWMLLSPTFKRTMLTDAVLSNFLNDYVKADAVQSNCLKKNLKIDAFCGNF